MEVSVTKNGVSIKATGATQMEVFRELSSMEEVFGHEPCGKCGSDDVSFRIRMASDSDGEEYEYPEKVCKCWAKLAFGQGKDGLFPIRFERKGKKYVTDDDGKKIPKGTNGWVKWNFDKECEE